MNKLFFLALLFISTPLFAQDTPVLTTEEPKDPRKFNPYSSHWLVSFGFEGMKYETFENFTGEEESFSPGEQELWGGRIGLGREFHLGSGFFTSTKVESFFVGTLFTQIKNGGDEDEDVKFAFTKRRGHVFGAEASQSLGYLFNMKTKNPIMDEWAYLTVEPFIEAGVGMARAYNRITYGFDLDTTDEAYRLKVTDELVNAKIGAGVNFTSTSGYFLYIKVTQNRYDVTDRKAKEVIKRNGNPSQSSKPDLDDNIDAITVYAIGGGYKF